MKKDLQKLPPALQKQLMLRFGVAALSLLAVTLSAIWFRDLVLCVPFLLLFLVSGAGGTALLTRLFRGRFVRVEGICAQVERTGIRHRPKSLVVSAGEHTVKIHLRGKLGNAAPGDRITVYLADNMPVYQRDGYEVVNGYLAIDIIKTGVGVHGS